MLITGASKKNSILKIAPVVLAFIISMGPKISQALANPASSYCLASGGKLVIKDDAKGNQYGFCVVSKTLAFEEWCLFKNRQDARFQCENKISKVNN